MRKVLKKSLAILLSLMMTVSVVSAAAIVSADTDYTMTAIVAMKPQDGDELLATRHIFNLTEEQLTALNGGNAVDLATYGFEAEWGIGLATSEDHSEYLSGNWDQNHWGFDSNGNLYYETRFPLVGGATPAEEYAAASRGELKGILREYSETTPQDGVVHDTQNRPYAPDMKANEVMNGMDTIRLTLTTDEVYYAAPAVTTKNITLSNCDSLDGWFPFDGDELFLDTEVKTEGSASIRYPHTGGVAWGTSLNHMDLTGLKSISFDIAANNTGILTEPTDKYLFLFSGGDPASFGFREVVNGENAILNDAELVSRMMQFDVSAFENYTLSDDGKTFVTVTLTPSIIGENFDYADVTGFLHWSCSSYGGDHTEWIDNLVATVETSSEDAKEYVDLKTWGVDQFNAAVVGDAGDNLSTSDTNLYSVYARPTVYGMNACGMVGYPSYGCDLNAIAGHKYVYEFDVWVNDVAEDEKEEVLFYGDLYNHDAVDDATVNTYFTNGITLADFNDVASVNYNKDFGYKYKTVTDTLTATESGYSEPRIYYNRLTLKNQGDRDSYAVGDINFYECRIYDETADPFHAQPVVTLKPGTDSNASFSSEVKPGNTNARELEALYLAKCAAVTLPKAKDCNNTLLFGNAAADLAAGDYKFTYSLGNIILKDGAAGTVATIKVMKDGAEVASYDVDAASVPADGNIAVEFTAAEAGKYSAELYINDQMGFCLNSIALGVALDQSDIDAVVEKINAIGDVKYDPDKDEDSGELITAARDAYTALCEKYSGVDMSSSVENYELLVSCESSYASLKEEYDTMIENAETVKEAINAIQFPITKDSEDAIVTAEETLNSFIEYFGQDKADLHIGDGIIRLKQAREDFDKLSDAVYGDVDGDGKITVTDALMVLQHSVGKITLDETVLKNADVDGEEGITVTDALAILQASVDKISLPIVKA